MIRTFTDIMEAAGKGEAKRCLVLPPVTDRQIAMINEAIDGGLPVVPLFQESKETLGRVLKKTPLRNVRPYHLPGAVAPEQALAAAVTLIREGRADILIRGGMAIDTFMGGILDRKNGLMSGGQASYVSLFQLRKPDRLILATDTYLHNAPSLSEKAAILENALRLARLVEMPFPVKVAALAAIEQVNPGIPSTLEAAILSKMSQCGQFENAIVEGPLDIDCAVNRKAALRKGVKSVVTGHADVYLVPEIETGYQFAQLLDTIGQLPAAGFLTGTVNPVVLDLPFIRCDQTVIEWGLAVLAAQRDRDVV